MKEKFNLSKREDKFYQTYMRKDIKEFIKKLKEELCDDEDYDEDCVLCNFKKKIDKLAGDKLI